MKSSGTDAFSGSGDLLQKWNVWRSRCGGGAAADARRAELITVADAASASKEFTRDLRERPLRNSSIRHQLRPAWNRGIFTTLTTCAVVLLALVVSFSQAMGATDSYAASTRGFGNVKVSLHDFSTQQEKSSWTVFDCEDPAHAALTASKRMADLLGFGDIKPARANAFSGTLLELPGAGAWLLGVEGNRFHEFFASSENQLKKLVSNAKLNPLQAVPERAYPRWLDCFDNAATAICYEGGGAPVDIDSEFPWVKKHGFAYMYYMFPMESQYVAPGVFDSSVPDWFGAKCREMDIPFRTIYWELYKPSWYWNRKPLPYIKGTPGRLSVMPGFYHENEALYRIPYGSEPIAASDPFSFDARMQFLKSIKDDPNFVGTMAVAEVGLSGVALLGTVSEMSETIGAWHNYLSGTLGYDLSKLGQAHYGRKDYYRSWDEVKVPVTQDFMGFDDTSLHLAGKGWESVADYDIKKTSAYIKPGSPPAPKAIPSEGWVPAISNDRMFWSYARRRSSEKLGDIWLRRKFTVGNEQLSTLKYLHVERTAALRRKYCDAYLNGNSLKQVTNDRAEELTSCFAAGGNLQVGENELVLRMEGMPPIGFITLGKLPLRLYPGMSKAENRRWYDASNFVSWLRMRGVERTLQAMRTVEPNRPLKMMAMVNHMDMAIPLAKRYGGYVHDTGGATGYWCPYTGAKISRAHGMPFSVEPGGPPRNAKQMQSFIAFNIMYGNDAIDLVFATTHFKDKPDVNQWIDENLELLKSFGKMHQPKQSIGMLFSARNMRLGFGQPERWHLGRGALQQVGRNFVQIETSDMDTPIMDQYPVVLDCATVQMTQREVDAILRYVEKGGIFVAQQETARHLPDETDVWLLAKKLGLKVIPKWMSGSNFHRWKQAKIKLSKEQDLLPSLKGKTIEGSGVSIDWLGAENSSAVAYAPTKEGKFTVKPVATWEGDGTMAIAEVPLGRGKIILLGTPLFTRMKDEKGIWVNDEDRGKLLDEFLTGLGAPRDSWGDGVWAEIWRSKNGVYDLYKTARISRKGDKTLTSAPRLRRSEKIDHLVEVSALGHPKVPVDWRDGVVTLPKQEYEMMKARLYLAPRAEIARAGLDWFRAQSQIWRELPLLPDSAKPRPIPVPDDVIPIIQDWKVKLNPLGEEWRQEKTDTPSWKRVKLGTFVAMGMPHDSQAAFRRSVDIPAAWRGRQINLCFTAPPRKHGVTSRGRLWINGEMAKVRQPLQVGNDASFICDITEHTRGGRIDLALQVDGRWRYPKHNKIVGKGRERPSGVTGVFFLEAVQPAVKKTPLSAPWFAGGDVGNLTPVNKGEEVTYTYLETRFTLPEAWPAERLFLERPDGRELMHLCLNNQFITVNMSKLDISKLVTKNGENVLRWVPGSQSLPGITVKQTMKIPDLNLVWTAN
jgi:hypothetical protein